MIGAVLGGVGVATRLRGVMTAVGRQWQLVLIALLIAGLLLTRATLADTRGDLAAERAARKLDAATAKAATAQLERDYLSRQADAVAGYAERLANRSPILIRSTDTVRTYAQTDAGRVRCLAADRVLGLDALDRDLALDPRPAGGGAGALQPDPGPPTG